MGNGLKDAIHMWDIVLIYYNLSPWLLNIGKCKLFTNTIEDDRKAMLEAGIKTLDEVKKDVHVDPLTNMNKSTNPAAATTSNAAAVDVEMISKLLEGGVDKT